MKYVYLALCLGILGLIFIPGIRGVGHGAFEVPIRIEAEKEIREVHFQTIFRLMTDTGEPKTLGDWREPKKIEGGAYIARVTFSSGSHKRWLIGKTKYTYLHADGIKIRVRFTDGTEIITISPLQKHPKDNLIIIKLNGSNQTAQVNPCNPPDNPRTT